MTSSEYFKSLTIPKLKEILKDFNFVGYSSMRKSELVNAVVCLMDGAHLDAVKYAETHYTHMGDPKLMKAEAEYRFNNDFSGLNLSNRIAGYDKQNGGARRLTNRQQRRISKKFKHQIAQGYNLATVMGE